MKKFLSMILALTLVLALSVPAFADYSTSASESQDVEADYTAPVDTKGDTVYRITITWEPTEEDEALSYTGKNSTYNWDSTNLIYVETVNNQEAIGWAGSAGYSITVTNYSDDAVTAATSATNNYGLELAEPEETEVEIGSAAVTEEGVAIEYTNTTTNGNAQEAEFTYTYAAKTGATAPTGNSGKVTVGSITVKIDVD